MIDIFNNTTSLAIIAILLLVIGVCFLFVYIEYVKRDQNHKIASMLSLVTSITEEVQSIRNFMSVITAGHVNQISVSNGNGGANVRGNDSIPRSDARDEFDDSDDNKDTDLIEVSDEEEDSEDGYSTSEDEDSDEEEEQEDEQNDEDNEESDDEVYEGGNEIDVDDLDSEAGEDVNDIENGEFDVEPTEESVFQLKNELDSLIVEDDIVTENTVTGTVTEVVEDLVTDVLEEPVLVSEQQKDTIRSISLEDDGIRIVESNDYKKMSLAKLKHVVVEKKLVADASKLKKNEILKLLGVDSH
jgi:preprotein translocase subunit YajC